MFHKPAQIKPYAAIKGSERKTLISRIETQAGQEFSAEQRAVLVPKSMQSAKCILKSGKKAQIYAAEGIPYYTTIGDALVPTIYVLAASQLPLVPTVYTVPNTLKFLVSGADFMIPGIFGDLPDASKGSVVVIRSLDGPILATGVALVDLNKVGEERGKAVEVVNVRGDTLLGEDKVRLVEGVGSGTTETGSAETTETAELAPTELAPTEQAPTPPSPTLDIPLTLEEADDAFMYAAPRALAYKQEYPMPSATFAKLLAENFPYEHPQMLIKNTSWKKLPKFIKHLEKEGLFTAKEQKGDTVILALSAELEALAVDAPEQSKPKPQKKEKIEAVVRYKLKSSASDIAPTNPYFSASEIKSMLSEYIKTNNLKDKANVRIDDTLRKACGLKQDIETLIVGKVVEEFVKHSTSAYHQINHNGEPGKLAKGPIPQIHITTERKGGNKVVTKVVGMEPFGFEAKPFAEHLRVACAGSTTVGETKAGKNTKAQPIVQIQGDHVAKISGYLEKEGVKSSWIKR